MPLFRSLGMRILDGFIDRLAINGPVRIDTFAIPRQDYISRLRNVGDLYHAVGKITDHTTGFNLGNFVTSPADYYCSSDESDGYRIDDVNHDLLLMPNGSGDFSISFWIYPCGYSGQDHVVIAKALNTGFYRYKISISSSSVITFIAANRFGTAEENVTSLVTFGRWNFVVARCNGTERLLSLDVLGEDGVVDRNKKDPLMDVGCWNPAGPLTVAVDSDLVSGKLAAGRFLLQQVCFWGKVLSGPEERELFFDGRGNQRWHDRSIPDTYQVHAGAPKLGHVGSVGPIMQDVNGAQITVIHDEYETSPYVPCKSCDSEPNCWHFANRDVSPDSISVHVTWVASMNSSSASLPVSNVVLNRNQNQIVQGFRFGRTFESEAIPLTNGIEVVFFLESTPYHMLTYDYRRYFGVECRFGEKKKIVKFRLTSGVPLVKNPEPGAENVFKSPSPSGAMFNFPYSDSFQQYANEIVSAGWTDFAQVLNYEPFPFKPGVEAACLVANGYRFTIGKEEPWSRGGVYGWQMGVSEFASNPPQTMDSLYNYLIKARGPGVFPGQRVVATETGLNSPFSAVAKDAIVAHDEKNNRTDLSGLPFDVSAFIAVMTSGQFVRPESSVLLSPQMRARTGAQGCIDCDITASFYSQYNVFTLNPKRLRSVTIPRTKCPQKTTSGAISVYSSGAAEEGVPDAQAISRVFYAGENNSLFLSEGADNSQSMLVGGTLRPDGSMQFSGQIEQTGTDNYPSLFYDIRPDTKIDPNNPGTYLVPISKTTKLDARRGLDFGLNFPIQPTETIDEYNSRRLEFYQEENPDSGFHVTTDGWGQFPYPTGAMATITVGNCNDCRPGDCVGIKLVPKLKNIVWPGGGTGVSEIDFGRSLGAITDVAGTECNSRIFPARTIGSTTGTTSPRIVIEIISATTKFDCPDVIVEIRYKLTYQILHPVHVHIEDTRLGHYKQCQDHPNPYDFWLGWDDTTAPQPNPRTIIHDHDEFFVTGYTQFRVATYKQAFSDADQCLRPNPNRNRTVDLPFFSDVAVSPRAQRFQNQAEADLAYSGCTPGQTAPFTGPPTQCAHSNLTAHYCAIGAGKRDMGYTPIEYGGDGWVHDVITTFTPATAPAFDVNDPDVSLGGGPVELRSVPVDPSAYVLPYGYSLQYQVKIESTEDTFSFNGTYVLIKDLGKNWVVETNVAPYLIAVLSSGIWTLEFFAPNDSQDCRKVVARYRIAGYPDSRFNRLGKTQMQLVSADWSVGQWPFYVIVEPV